MNRMISTTLAPIAMGPYVQAIDTGTMLFVSGQVGLDPQTLSLAYGLQDQTRQCLLNLEEIVKAAGYDVHTIVKCTVYLRQMHEFALMNEAYQSFFQSHKPARTTVEVTKLPKDALIEIDAIAVR